MCTSLEGRALGCPLSWLGSAWLGSARLDSAVITRYYLINVPSFHPVLGTLTVKALMVVCCGCECEASPDSWHGICDECSLTKFPMHADIFMNGDNNTILKGRI